MLPPVQNQDLVQRSDTTSAMRSQEQGKIFGDIAKSAADMHRIEELKNNTVQKDDGSEALNPDGSGGGQEQQQRKKSGGRNPTGNQHPRRAPVKT